MVPKSLGPFAARFPSTVRPRALSLVQGNIRVSSSASFSAWPKGRAWDDSAVGSARVRSFSHAAAVKPSQEPIILKRVTLKDGTQATVEIAGLGGRKDCDDLSDFYQSLSSFSGIKGDRCSDRCPGGSSDIGFHAPRQLEIARKCADDGGRVIVLRAEENGISKIVGACMMDYVADTAWAHRMVTADAFAKKGVASALKEAQIECAQADSRTTMRTYGEPEPAVLTAYDKACRKLNLAINFNPFGPVVDLRPGSGSPQADSGQQA